MRYLKDNWPHLMATLLGSIVSTAFALGIGWNTLGNRVSAAERRLDEIDKAQVAETRWQVGQNTSAVAAGQIDARRIEAAVAQINTRLGVIDAKLDGIAETLKRRPN